MRGLAGACGINASRGPPVMGFGHCEVRGHDHIQQPTKSINVCRNIPHPHPLIGWTEARAGYLEGAEGWGPRAGITQLCFSL
ncbi:hypothetical protein FKM82_019342 [Ascaphus truei]